VPEVTVAAVAARDQARADAFALRHGIGKAYGSYEDLLTDPDIDAVYNPLPNSLHGPWTLMAIAAGKHVLCEKPFASNAEEAAQVADAASASGLVVMEAMHYRYHPLIRRLTELVAELGPVRQLQCWTSFAIADPGDIRYDFALGGGALMDGGCYALDCLRLLGASGGQQGEPTVTGALADPVVPDAGGFGGAVLPQGESGGMGPPGREKASRAPRGAAADRSLAARLEFPGGAAGWFESSFTRDGDFRADLHVIGQDGLVWLDNFIFPSRGRLRATKDGAVVADEPGGGEPSYVYQLRAFAAAVAGDGQVPTSAAHAAVTMRLIDDAYRAAGLLPRPAEQLG
jgi:predicted dehydrogenase